MVGVFPGRAGHRTAISRLKTGLYSEQGTGGSDLSSSIMMAWAVGLARLSPHGTSGWHVWLLSCCEFLVPLVWEGVSLLGLDRPPIVATTDLGVGQLFGHLGGRW